MAFFGVIWNENTKNFENFHSIGDKRSLIYRDSAEISNNLKVKYV